MRYADGRFQKAGLLLEDNDNGNCPQTATLGFFHRGSSKAQKCVPLVRSVPLPGRYFVFNSRVIEFTQGRYTESNVVRRRNHGITHIPGFEISDLDVDSPVEGLR